MISADGDAGLELIEPGGPPQCWGDGDHHKEDSLDNVRVTPKERQMSVPELIRNKRNKSRVGKLLGVALCSHLMTC